MKLRKYKKESKLLAAETNFLNLACGAHFCNTFFYPETYLGYLVVLYDDSIYQGWMLLLYRKVPSYMGQWQVLKNIIIK